MKVVTSSLIGFLFSLIPGGQTISEDGRRSAFAEVAAGRILPRPSVRGDEPDWFFLVKELRHLAAGTFWERQWEEVAVNGSDPVPSILEFHQLLEERGIRLLLVPVPAKAAIYPDKLAVGFEAGDAEPLEPFLERIRKGGVRVLDLEPHFLAMRAENPEKLLYCRQDAHFSPYAIEFVSRLIAEELSISKPDAGSDFRPGEPERLTFVGDQITGSEWEGTVVPEVLEVRRVTKGDGNNPEPDPESPILLLGDSHTLVFHFGKENGMHCAGAGVLDHLSARFGMVPDLVGVVGSGMVQARKKLYYRAAETPGFWETKKVVVWLFSAREFTQSPDRPLAIPLDR